MNRARLPQPLRILLAAVLGALALSATGCGTYHLNQHIQDSHWADQSGVQFYGGFRFLGDGFSGRAVVTFRGPDGPFDVPARYTIDKRGEGNSPTGWIAIAYEPTEELKVRYREAVKRLKADAKSGGEAAKVPDELPEKERFRAIGRYGSPEFTLTSESDLAINLSRGAVVDDREGEPRKATGQPTQP